MEDSTVGPRLKKKRSRTAHHHLRRRKRTERATATGTYLGAARADSGAAVPLQLEGALGQWPESPAGTSTSGFIRTNDSRAAGGGLRSPLLRHLPGKLLVVWDGLPAHRARLVSEFIRAQRGRLAIERLPGYAPELNPAEYIWGYWKQA